MSEICTLVFSNADATPKTAVVVVARESVHLVMEWYGSHHAGDRYTVTLNGRNAPMGINGEPCPIRGLPLTRNPQAIKGGD
jgi:hypothetical protein